MPAFEPPQESLERTYGSESGGSLMDLLIMVIAADRERTYAEVETLVREAEFMLVRAVPAGSGLSILGCRITNVR
jgi:hypothetical protein